MADANRVDLSQFARWYETSGTPVVTYSSTFDQEKRCYTVHNLHVLLRGIIGAIGLQHFSTNAATLIASTLFNIWDYASRKTGDIIKSSTLILLGPAFVNAANKYLFGGEGEERTRLTHAPTTVCASSKTYCSWMDFYHAGVSTSNFTD